MMHASEKAIAYSRDKEKYRPTAYKPTPDDVPTLGWGHTVHVKMGDTCTREEADCWHREEFLDIDAVIREHVTVPLEQHQWDALACFIHNIGKGAFIESTLLRKLNDRDYGGAKGEFKRWTKQKGKSLAGLVIRRQEEEDMFGGKYP